MFTLIKREFRDNLPLIAAITILVCIVLVPFYANYYNSNRLPSTNDFQNDIIDFTTFLGNMLPILLIIFGIFQVHLDKHAKISAFHLSLPVTRKQLFTAKAIVGLLAVICIVLPAWLLMIKVNGTFIKIAQLNPFEIHKAFMIIFLMSLTAYSNSLLICMSKIGNFTKLFFIVLCQLLVIFLVIYNGLKANTATALTIWSICAIAISCNKFTIKPL